MNKISIIIKREYLTRVKKKSFIIMTILGPLLMASIWIVPIYLATVSNEEYTVQVLDETGLFRSHLTDTDNIHFVPLNTSLSKAKKLLSKSEDLSLLYIPATELNVPATAVLYSSSQPSIDVTSQIKDMMKREVESLKLQASGVNPDILRSIKSNVQLNTIRIDKEGNEKKSFTEVSLILGIFSGLLIYMFIFIFGSQVMRGVIEEKTNRIVEVIISSVRPFQLMMGKIVGVALVGLTQFLLWVVLTFSIVTAFQLSLNETPQLSHTESMYSRSGKILNPEQLSEFSKEMKQQDSTTYQILEAINSIDYGVMIGAFLFFFLGGYLMYAALFAAIGSAVDSETDTQQFMLPITIPLILSMVMVGFITTNPTGPIAFWFSIIPLTSPVIMMARIPFGVPYWQIFLAMGLLVIGFLFTTWLAAKIYRTGILMYGKRTSYKELWKWIKYSNT